MFNDDFLKLYEKLLVKNGFVLVEKQKSDIVYYKSTERAKSIETVKNYHLKGFTGVILKVQLIILKEKIIMNKFQQIFELGASVDFTCNGLLYNKTDVRDCLEGQAGDDIRSKILRENYKRNKDQPVRNYLIEKLVAKGWRKHEDLEIEDAFAAFPSYT